MANPRNLLLTIKYDGRDFCGWQRQPHMRTVQGELESVLSFVLGEEVQIAGTSRTDAGVHALGQRASLTGEWIIPTTNLKKAANNILTDIQIIDIEEKPLDFHARHNSCGKTYVYRINFSENSDIFKKDYEYQLVHKKKKLIKNSDSHSLEEMRLAASQMVGSHDFRAFMAQGSFIPATTVKTIYGIDIDPEGENLIIAIRGSGFLYNMVRIIAGTLIEVWGKKLSHADISGIIASKDRSRAGHTAPPQGLYLKEVYYEVQSIC